MDNKKKNNSPIKSYARYSALAFQMCFIILLGVFLGIKIDKWLKTDFPVATVSLSLLFTIGAIYYAIKDLINKK